MEPSPAIPTAAHLAALKQAREVELIRKFCDGQILPEAEMVEISHILPASVLANPPPAVLKKTPQEIATEIGTSARTIFRWLDTGRRAKDPCPLNEPAKVLAWWTRNMRHRTPEYLESWVAAQTGKVAVPATVVRSSTPNTPVGTAAVEPGRAQPAAARESVDMDQLRGIDLDGSTVYLRRSLEAAGILLNNAYGNPDDQALAHYQSRFEKAAEQLRKHEQAVIALQKARGDLAPRGEFRSDLVSLLTGLRGMMRRRADNVCAALSHALTPEQLVLVRTALQVESQREEKLIRSARHWKELPTGEIQLPAA